MFLQQFHEHSGFIWNINEFYSQIPSVHVRFKVVRCDSCKFRLPAFPYLFSEKFLTVNGGFRTLRSDYRLKGPLENKNGFEL